jgi:uncharacterized protein (TIGR02145 family)/uncharacterized repeat protein (TIGR02543 family)
MANNKKILRTMGGLACLLAATLIPTCDKVDDNCGRGEPYNPDFQFCFDGRAHNLCGGYRYNPLTEGCEKNAVVRKCPDGTFAPLNSPCDGYVVEIRLVPDEGGGVTRVPDKPRYASGDNVTLHAEAHAGYTFTGWAGAAVSADESIMLTVDGNKPIIAVFNKINGGASAYMLASSASPKDGGTVFVNGSAVADEPTTHSSGATVAVRAEPATGYTFKEWSGALTSASRNAAVTMDGNKILVANFTPAGGAKSFTVSFDTDGGSPSMISGVSVDSGSALGASLPSVTRTGYVFGGWVDRATGEEYAANTAITKDVALTAEWTAGGVAKSFTVEFDANGGSPSIINSVSVDNGKTLGTGTPNLPPDPTKAGYTFGGWFDGTTLYTSRTVITQDVMLIAGWIKHLAIAFDTDGGSPSAINPITVDSGSTFGGAVLPADPAKTGWSFGGWFNGAERYTQSTVITQSVTLTAVWMYKVSFNTNGGSPNTLSDALVARNGTLGTAIPAVTKDGYILNGWFDGTTQYTPNTSITKNVTLTANFRQDGAQTGNVTDSRNNKTYKTVKIGDYWWMAENLNVVTDSSWCYNNADSNCVKYGRLYAWNAAKSACQGMGSGWRLPDRGEWNSLMDAVGGILSSSNYFYFAGTRLKSTSGWGSSASNNGTDDFGFSALPGGYRVNSGGSFGNVGDSGYWWSATEDGSDYAYYRGMYYSLDNVNESSNNKSSGHSVRCVAQD